MITFNGAAIRGAASEALNLVSGTAGFAKTATLTVGTVAVVPIVPLF